MKYVFCINYKNISVGGLASLTPIIPKDIENKEQILNELKQIDNLLLKKKLEKKINRLN